MDYNDSSDFTIPSQESNILSQSLLMPSSSSNTSSSSTASAGADLSLSELSLVDRPETVRRRPFSLLAQPLASEESAIAEEDDDDGLDETMRVQNAEAARKEAAKTREAKLQQDLFILKKLNAVLETYKGALRETRSNTEVLIAERLTNTNTLLDKYMNILSKSDQSARLIMDERWEGAEADEEQLDREHQEELDRRRREQEEAEERVRLARLERERLEREAKEKAEREERLRVERERADATSKFSARGSGVRGVRGTRASTRGMRGTTSTRGTTFLLLVSGLDLINP
ncbi:hypothetical protein NLI96_g11170 [Meripilus lineatus]|uniref:DASH complex subunit DUO1 n=1 Tax=Meripilus lineatus TaxID=2056292 RepID=A0AAD5UTT7_9APHY|nr:hypothetical protein NLI96_g11170 [Physisporinus lineatus]